MCFVVTWISGKAAVILEPLDIRFDVMNILEDERSDNRGRDIRREGKRGDGKEEGMN